MSEEIPEAPGLLASGSHVSGYLIRELIGRGGMAEVFLATDERLNRPVALKVLSPALAADHAFRERFIRESATAAAVDDPHILPVFEAGQDAGVLFIAMRYVRGGDLRSTLRRDGPLTPARAARLVRQAASALDAAHRHGLVHRDVKPANLLLDHGGRAGGAEHVYLSDFGISKPALAATGLTGTGQFVGTVDYIAPEQIEGRAVDGRADQYSLACAAFELLTGQPPFHGDAAVPVMFAQLHEPPPSLDQFRADLPAVANAVFSRALAKEPAQRYECCADFATALTLALGLPGPAPFGPAEEPAVPAPATRDWVAAGPATSAAASAPRIARAPSPVPPVPPTAFPRVGRRPAPAVTIAASIVLAGAIVAASVMIGTKALSGGHGSGPAGVAATGPPAGSPTGGAGSGSGSAPGGQPASPPGVTGAKAGIYPKAGTYQLAGTLAPGSAGMISSIAWTPDGAVVAAGDQNGSVYLFNVASGQRTGPVLTASGCGKVFAVAISPDGSTLAAGCKTGFTALWNLGTGNRLGTLSDPASNEINSLAFSPDGTTLATADGNGSTYLWNVSGQSLTATLTDPAGSGIAIWSAAFSDRGVLATGDYNGHVYLWNPATGATEGSFTMPGSGPGDAVTALAFSASGSLLAAGDAAGGCFLWNTSGGAGGQLGPTPAQPIWGMSFAGDTTLAMADNDGGIYLWRIDPASVSATSAGRLADPASGAQGVGALAYSPGGSWLVSGDTNGQAYRWRVG